MAEQVFTFKPQKATLRLEINGQSYDFKRPSVGDLDELEEILAQDGASKKYVKIYKDFFEKLGLQSDVIKSLDYDDLISFIQFVSSPKKKD